jgi:hypothetical protein
MSVPVYQNYTVPSLISSLLGYINWAIAWTFAKLWFNSSRGQKLRFSKTIRPILEPIKPPTQQTPGVLSLIIKRSGPKLISLPSKAEVKNERRYTSSPPHAFIACTERSLPLSYHRASQVDAWRQAVKDETIYQPHSSSHSLTQKIIEVNNYLITCTRSAVFQRWRPGIQISKCANYWKMYPEYQLSTRICYSTSTWRKTHDIPPKRCTSPVDRKRKDCEDKDKVRKVKSEQSSFVIHGPRFLWRGPAVGTLFFHLSRITNDMCAAIK